MREILFRAKRLDNGEWVEGAYCPKSCDSPFGPMIDKPSIIKLDDPFSGFWFDVHDVHADSVGQYTGLCDKNGKKIFEGDILHRWSEYCDEYDGICVVKYGKFNCGCCDGVYGWYLDGGDIRFFHSKYPPNYEVCGNIHDNPELLEG